MKTPYLFFDLDGTLSNSEEGILNAVAYALKKVDFPIPPRKDLRFFIGPPLSRSFAKLCSVDEKTAKEYVENYREYYRDKGIFECSLYGGIPALLADLSAAGAKLVLATCKPTVLSARVIEHFGLSPYFEMISGPEFDGTRGEKHEVIAYAMEKLQISDPSSVLMIGDRSDDVLGAKKNGISACGVLWGFGTKEELETAGASALLPSVSSAREFLLDWVQKVQKSS